MARVGCAIAYRTIPGSEVANGAMSEQDNTYANDALAGDATDGPQVDRHLAKSTVAQVESLLIHRAHSSGFTYLARHLALCT